MIMSKSSQWVFAPCGDHAQPICFGRIRLRFPKGSESDRLCSACMGLGSRKHTLWKRIDKFRKVAVGHHHSFDALLESARGGCHLCGLLLIAWEENCDLSQDPSGGWVGKAGPDVASLNDGIRLEFQRVETSMPLTGLTVDEVHITILCGGLPSRMGGRLICKAIDCERFPFLEHLQCLAID